MTELELAQVELNQAVLAWRHHLFTGDHPEQELLLMHAADRFREVAAKAVRQAATRA